MRVIIMRSNWLSYHCKARQLKKCAWKLSHDSRFVINRNVSTATCYYVPDDGVKTLSWATIGTAVVSVCCISDFTNGGFRSLFVRQ